jgi:hypothetical protein
MRSMSEATCEIKRQALFDELAEILAFVQHAFQEGGTAHEVESGLWQRMLRLGSSWRMAARCVGSLTCIGVRSATCSVCSS